MLLPGENCPTTWLFVTILVSTIIALSESSGAKTLDVKIGFDITQGGDGAPLLHIRNFEDEYNPRAVDDGSSSENFSKKKPSGRGDSSDSEEREHKREKQHPKKEESSKESKEHAKVDKSSNDSDEEENTKSSVSREDSLRSTRGLKASDFEPEEENPKLHGRYQKNSESEATSDDERRRYRRHLDRLVSSR